MKRFIEGEDRTQVTLFPESLDDYVAEDNPVRVIDVFINELDLTGLGFRAAPRSRTISLPCDHCAPPTPSESADAARRRSSGSWKLRSTPRLSSSSSLRSGAARCGGTTSISFSSIARMRRAIWMLSLPYCRISVFARPTKLSQSGVR